MKNFVARGRVDTRNLLSLLWIVVMLNMLTADILSLFIPGVLDEVVEIAAETSIPVSRLMLFGAIMIEIPILMIIFSRILRYLINRWLNIVASTITILFVVGPEIGNESVKPHYVFVAFVEVVCLIAIWVIAWKWRELDDQPTA